MNLKKLSDPFREDEVEFRLAQCGESGSDVWAQCLAYITSRAIMDRLDDVCGPENWKVSYEFHDKGVVCNLSIRIGDEWVTKQDGAEQTNIEAFKGGISGALKRAGSVWGMGRYLYCLEAGWAEIVPKNTKGANYGKTKSGKVFYWIPPQLPDWALPKQGKPEEAEKKPEGKKKPEAIVPPKETPKPEEKKKLSDEQLTALQWLFATANDAGWSKEDIKASMEVQWPGIASTKDLSREQIQLIVNYMKANPKQKKIVSPQGVAR